MSSNISTSSSPSTCDLGPVIIKLSLPSSRGKLLRYAVVKRVLPSSVLAISASSRARHPSECPRARFPSARHRHPRHPPVSPCFMRSALLMYRRRPFRIAFASAIAAGELTSGNTIRTSLTFLGPSQGLADTEFRIVRSTRSVAEV